jgi:hemolysin activation/secretion protein
MIALWACLVLVLVSPALLAAESDLPNYPVSRFHLEYLRENPDHPPIAELLETSVQLAREDGSFIVPSADEEAEWFTLAELNQDAPRQFHAAALQRILEATRDALLDRQLQGVYVAPDPQQIDRTGRDLRPEGRTELRIVIVTGVVTRMRSLAHGERIDPSERVNHPRHARILSESPIRPRMDDQPVSDLIYKNALDEYVLLLSRHPGRRVDVALAAAPETGGVALDYLITEVKPWLVYAEIANTGTENTSDLREQFGFRHYQLTNNDDILAFDYSTAGFDEVHAVYGSYDTRLFDSNRLRGQIYGRWSEYTASDVGLNNDTFTGESWSVGGDLLYNVYQQGITFIDFGGGVRYEHLETSDTLPGSIDGNADLVVPRLTGRFERLHDWAPTRVTVNLELMFDQASGTELSRLGRPDVDDQWALLMWDASQSLFLEPLLDREAWQDPTTPRSSTLAHELYFLLRGQSSFGDRIIPQHEMVAGGLYTVRGYDESITAGDTVVIATAEYRFHLPKALPIEPEPGELFGETFRFSPQHVYGPTDWDLMLKGFLDAAWVTEYAGAGLGRDSEHLISTGVGLELQYKRNLTVRIDWGVVLHEVDGEADEGDNRVHFLVRLLF